MTSGPRPCVILLVEDDYADQLMVRRALDESPFPSRLCIVNDGAEALDYLDRNGMHADPGLSPRPDLVLVDLNMPRLPGRELLRILRADPRFQMLPIVVLTTSTSPRDVAEAYELGASSYIVKPRGFDELRRVLDTVQEYWCRVVELPPTG